MVKKLFFLTFVLIISCIFTPKTFAQQQKDSAEGQAIDLNKAKKLAETYLVLLKSGQIEQAFDTLHIPNYNPDNKDSDLEFIKLFHQEFGNIIDYKFKESQWHKPLFRYHLDPDKNLFKDKPDKIEEPPYLSLIYEVQCSKLKLDKEIQIVNDEGILKIQKTEDKFTSPVAMIKMMNLMKKLPKKPKE